MRFSIDVQVNRTIAFCCERAAVDRFDVVIVFQRAIE